MRALALGLVLAIGATAPVAARPFTDSAGRTVELPDRVAKVFAAGPPASVLVYTLAPEKLAGWVSAPRAEERPFLAAAYVDLPVHGRLTGRGGTANIEAVVAMRPDLVLDVGTVNDTYVSLADRVQAQTGIPVVLLDGAFLRTPALYRELGALIGEPARAEELAAYAERALADVASGLAAVPPDARPRVYYGRGPDGLETGLAGSINMEILDVVGAVNVAAEAGRGGLTRVSPEQLLAWNPALILTQHPDFDRAVRVDPLWKGLAAVRDGRVYRAPAVPFGWIDFPPGVNRLIGVRWLTATLYPDRFPSDLRAVTREFYQRFYHVELDDQRLDALLAGAVGGRR